MRQLIMGLAAAVVGLAVFGAPALAQDNYPTKPVRMVLGFAAGGGTDTIARILAEKMSPILGQQVVVDNRPGAGGLLAASFVANEKPDGYTIYLSGTSTLIGPVFTPNAGYHPLDDFAPIANINRTPLALVANPAFEASTIPELIAAAKAKPGELFYATPGVGTTQHLLIEMLEADAGIDMQDASYQGAAPSIAAVISGEIPLAIISLTAAVEQERGGKIKILGVTSPERVADFPDVPTIGESVAGYGALPGNFLVAPAGTPQPIVEKLSGAVKQAMDDPALPEFLKKQGLLPAYQSASELAASLPQETGKWTAAAKSLPAKEN